jgi:DNA repair photolyase
MNGKLIKGRGATGNPHNRYQANRREDFDDGWGSLDEALAPLRTTLTADRARSVIARNESPDVPFDRSINPYRGCEHGCVYCYARPSHAWLGHSPGLDFESYLYYKPDAVDCLRRELAAKNYRCAPIALGVNTDAYQPVEQQQRLTRRILELLADCAHPVEIITKSALIERDIDLLSEMASRRLVSVHLSVTTLDRTLARHLEPRAASPQRRLRSIEALHEAGIPVGLLLAPVIPVLTDPEMESILEAAQAAGARDARMILLRLPHEVAPIFSDWLHDFKPDMAERVLQRIRDTRSGALNDSDFAQRMTGRGAYADLLQKRFALARRRLGYGDLPELDSSAFRAPPGDDGQMDLF